MVWQSTPYTLPAAVVAVVAAALGLFVWQRRLLAPGATEFGAFALAVTIWCGANALEFATADVAGKTFWTKIEYAGVVAVPPVWLVCIARYCGADGWITSRRLAYLAIVPAITFALAVTNELHGLIWQSIRVVSTGPFTMWSVTHGSWFWVHFAYSYLALGATTLIVLRFLVTSPRPFSGQAASLLVGMSAPWLANILYFVDASLFPYLDLTPFGFALGSVSVGWGLSKFGLFELVPIARAALIQALPDAILVLDARDRIIDANPAAGQLIGASTPSVIGRPVPEVLSWWATCDPGASTGGQFVAEVALGETDQRFFDLRVCSLQDANHMHVGRLVLLQDATERRRAKQERVQRVREQPANELTELALRRAAFLAEATRRLARSLELERVLVELQRLVVPAIADGIAVAIEDAPGYDRRVAVSCSKAADAEFLHNWRGVLTDSSMNAAPTLLEDVTRSRLVSMGCATEEVQMWHALRPRSLVFVPLRAGARTLGCLWLFTTCSGRCFGPADLDLARNLGQHMTIALVNVQLYQAARREITERRRAEEAVARAAAQEQALADFESQALKGADLGTLMAAATHLVGRTLGVDRAAILTFASERGGSLKLGASFGWPAEAIEFLPDSLAVGSGQATSDELVVIENWDELEAAGRAKRPTLLRDDGIRSTAVVVIRRPGDHTRFGWLEVDARLPSALGPGDAAFLQRVAHALAVAIERQDAQESLRHYAHALVTIQEDERRSLARVLHDEIGQQLTGLHLLLGTLDEPMPEAVVHLREAQSIVTELVDRVRDISIELRPAILDDLGLPAALRWLVEHYSTLTGMRVNLIHGDLLGRFAPTVEIAAYRIVQEALTNVARHAAVQSVDIRLYHRGDTLEVAVEDCGRGFDLEQVIHRAEAIGLSNMRERAAAAGGLLSIVSQPDLGTRITAEFPLGVVADSLVRAH